jgi:hypothetical protein
MTAKCVVLYRNGQFLEVNLNYLCKIATPKVLKHSFVMYIHVEVLHIEVRDISGSVKMFDNTVITKQLILGTV